MSVTILHRVDFQEPGTGLAGVILILPAFIACPAPAEDALAEPGDRVRGSAEIAHVLREAVGILNRRFPLLAQNSYLFSQLTEAIRGILIF